MSNEKIIKQTRCWVKSVVIDFGFCPFAKREMDNDRVRFVVCDEKNLENGLMKVIDECLLLDSNNEIETTLIIYPKLFNAFDDFLLGCELAEKLLAKQDYEGVYQVASFHPDYCFSDADNFGADKDDPANYTNRSPYPMFHLLREDSIEKALANFPNPDSIPEHNVKFARTQGLHVMKTVLDKCCQKE